MVQGKEIIIITGCSGRIGTRVAQKFADPRYAVIGIDIVPPKISSLNFEYINCDLATDESLNRTMDHVRQKYGEKIASVIHLAAYYNFMGGSWEMYEKVTVKGTERLLEAVKKFQTEQFLFSSTILVHAPCEPGQKITENWPMVASWEYPRSKIETEELLLSQKHGKIPLVIMRIAACYDNSCHSIPLANQIHRIYEKKLEANLFPGDTTHGTAFLHLDDLTDAIWLAVQRRFGLPNVLTVLVAEPETVSYGELQKVIGLLCHGQECKTYPVPKWFAKFFAWFQNSMPFMQKSFIKPWMIDIADQNYSCDVNLVQEKLGWAPKHSLRQTLPKMINHLKENPLAWYRENGFKIPDTMKKQ